MRVPRLFENLNKNRRCFLLIFSSFFLSSGLYLSWVYRLTDTVPSAAVDLLSMIVGYLCQAAGLGLFALAARKKPEFVGYLAYAFGMVMLILCGVPATRSTYLAGVLIFGLLDNLLIGVIAGFYLRELAREEAQQRGVLFGGGYGAATVAAWLLSRIGGHSFLKTGYVLLVYAAVSAFCIFYFRKAFPEEKPEERANEPAALPTEARKLLGLAAATVFFLSLVKNIGFGFPSADLVQGVDLELSRVLYTVGLLAAGVISDRSRKQGAICALVALITPFIMIALAGEPISVTVFWALDYLIYGFFSVFRVLLFSDLAKKLSAPWLAGFGLLFGRLGDAAGTGIYMALSGLVSPLVLTAALLFALTVFLFFRLYPRMYLADTARERNEREIFEHFSARFDLSPRERAVMRLVLEERSNAEIAQALYVSESTVKFHIHNILKKTGCKNRSMLLASYHTPAGDGRVT